MVYIAEDMIHKYHKDQQNGKTPNNLDMVHFLSMIENIKPTVNKILSEGYLEKIVQKVTFEMNILNLHFIKQVKDVLMR